MLKLDRVFCHEITTPFAITDLMARGMDRVFDPTKIKAVIDHVTPAKDSKTAEQGKILRDWARRHAIKDFFDIGKNGVCHAIFPEKGFVRPGYTIIMGDSHTCTHGAFGAFTAGIGTTDLEVGILKGVCAFHIFRQNMYNCGMFAIELPKETIDAFFTDYAGKDVAMAMDIDGDQIIIDAEGKTETIDFKVGEFDKTLVKEGGWVGYADKNY